MITLGTGAAEQGLGDMWVYHRGKDPRTSTDIVLCVDADGRDSITGYGDDEYAIHRDNLIAVPDWVADYAVEHYRTAYGDDYDNYMPPVVDPEHIVNSAGVWDDRDFVGAFFEDHIDYLSDLRGRDIYGFLTSDGAVVFPGTFE
jgi:hypothetical protein